MAASTGSQSSHTVCAELVSTKNRAFTFTVQAVVKFRETADGWSIEAVRKLALDKHVAGVVKISPPSPRTCWSNVSVGTASIDHSSAVPLKFTTACAVKLCGRTLVETNVAHTACDDYFP